LKLINGGYEKVKFMDSSFMTELLSFYPILCVILGIYALLLTVLSALGSFSSFHKAIFRQERIYILYSVRFILYILALLHYYDLYNDIDSTLPEIMVDPIQALLSMTFSLLWPLALVHFCSFLILRFRPDEKEGLLYQKWPRRLLEFLTQTQKKNTGTPVKMKRHPGQYLALLISKDINANRMIKTALETQQFIVVETNDGATGLSMAAFNYPDLVILDLKLTDMEGEKVLRHLREWTQAPAIILNSTLNSDEIAERNQGNHDHYMPTPLLSSDLAENISIVMRHLRHNDQQRDHSIYQTPVFKLDQGTRTLTVRKKEVHLTPLEFHLLSYMTKHPGQTITLKMIHHEFWGKHMDEDGLRHHIHNLRYKIELDPVAPKYILTESGIGYRLKNR